MTQVTVPAAGDPVTAAWGQAVANHANHLIPLFMSADASKTSTGFSTLGGLSFAAVSGKQYNVRLSGSYSVGGTSTGIKLGYESPGGTTRLFCRIYGNASATGVTAELLSSSDTATGTTTTDSTSIRTWELWGTYQCTSDGTFNIRYARGGSSTTVTVYAGSGGLVVEN